jgi:hypothetical protein
VRGVGLEAQRDAAADVRAADGELDAADGDDPDPVHGAVDLHLQLPRRRHHPVDLDCIGQAMRLPD